jgi:hypothetical protein
VRPGTPRSVLATRCPSLSGSRRSGRGYANSSGGQQPDTGGSADSAAPSGKIPSRHGVRWLSSKSGGYLQKRWCTTQSHIYRENGQRKMFDAEDLEFICPKCWAGLSFREYRE